jgi:hypothetical protein
LDHPNSTTRQSIAGQSRTQHTGQSKSATHTSHHITSQEKLEVTEMSRA